MSAVQTLNARDDLLELADLYEQVAALDPSTPSAGGAGVGPRVPPGVGELLQSDEVWRALADVDDWIGYCASIVASDVGDGPMPQLTPARLRYVAAWALVMLEQDDEVLARSFAAELARHLRVLRQLAHRGEHRVPVGVECRRQGCDGQLVSNLGGSDGTDSALRCDQCGQEVPFLVWHHWPRATVKFVTPEHAARLLGCSVNAVRIRAHREKWRRVGTGRDVRYLLDDVWAAS